MLLLVAGVLLWSFAHLFKRLAPDARAAMGGAGRGIMSIAILASMALMYLGYSHAPNDFYWERSPGAVGINNVLMLLAIYLMVAAATKSWITASIRHPQLTAIKSWSLGHLLVNGDSASIVLFGGLLAWAIISVIIINKQDGKPPLSVETSAGREVMTGLSAVLAFGGVAFIHISMGYPVFG